MTPPARASRTESELAEALANLTPERLQQWRELCAWLEEQRYNAAYSVKVHGFLTLCGDDAPAHRYGIEKHRQYKAIELERRAIGAMYWATGFGWRLRKDYRERLDAAEQAMQAASTQTVLPLPLLDNEGLPH